MPSEMEELGCTSSTPMVNGKQRIYQQASTEVQALVHAANVISDRVNHDNQVVFLTDALSVLQAMTSNKLPQLEKALHNI